MNKNYLYIPITKEVQLIYIVGLLHELQTSGVTLLGAIANAANKDNWTDIVKF